MAINQSIFLLKELQIVDAESLIISYPDGSKYTGTIHDNKRSGFGTMEWKSGASYTGNWINGVPESFGEYRWPDGRVY